MIWWLHQQLGRMIPLKLEHRRLPHYHLLYRGTWKGTRVTE